MTQSVPWRASAKRCHVCANDNLLSFRAFAHDGPPGVKVDILECTECSFAWQFPVLRTAQTSADVFFEAYNDDAVKKQDYFKAARRAEVARLQVEYLSSLSIKGRRLLDVGAGDGSFARAAVAAGWEVTALDPAIDPVKLADAPFSAVRGTLDDLPLGVRFDVVTLWDVIEHVEDPAAVLSAIEERTSDGARLILQTGNYKSVPRVVGGLGHWIYQIDHRWYFSPKSLEELLRQCGWSVESAANRVLRPSWRGSERARKPSIWSVIRSCLRAPVRSSAHLARFRKLCVAAEWPQSGLEIFCLVARRQAPVQQ